MSCLGGALPRVRACRGRLGAFSGLDDISTPGHDLLGCMFLVLRWVILDMIVWFGSVNHVRFAFSPLRTSAQRHEINGGQKQLFLQ